MSKHKRDYTAIVEELSDGRRPTLSYELARGILERLGFSDSPPNRHVFTGKSPNHARRAKPDTLYKGEKVFVLMHHGVEKEAMPYFVNMLRNEEAANKDAFWENMAKPSTAAVEGEWAEDIEGRRTGQEKEL